MLRPSLSSKLRTGAALASAFSIFVSTAAVRASELSGTQNVRAAVGTSVVVVEALFLAGQRCENAESLRWGTEGRCPSQTFASLRVKFDGTQLFVPYSAYADLSSIRKIGITGSQQQFELEVFGGDAATGYRAVLSFSSVRGSSQLFLVGRSVRSSEFPDAAWDKIEYGYNTVEESEKPQTK